MPIRIPNDLPAVKTLNDENIFVMTETRAITQDIRPLKILLLNLMPKKIETETQLSRLLGNSPLQVELELIHTKSHKSKNTPAEHLFAFYKTFDDVKDQTFDGMIITGAPVENMPFEEVNYWEELCEIMEWSKTHVQSTFHICWGAQAGLYYHFGIDKSPWIRKCSVYLNTRPTIKNPFFCVALMMNLWCRIHAIQPLISRILKKIPEIKILASSEEAGVYAMATAEGRQIFITGHSEYDANTLANEYFRDLNEGKPIEIPKNYFPDDNPENEPIVTWRSHANLLYSNWLNYFVYQTTPYDIKDIK